MLRFTYVEIYICINGHMGLSTDVAFFDQRCGGEVVGRGMSVLRAFIYSKT